MLAGITTLLTMSYILAINPVMFSELNMPAGDDFTESLPAFICIIMMPLTYSISNGILLGIIAYMLINLVCRNFRKLSPTMYILAILFILKYIFI